MIIKLRRRRMRRRRRMVVIRMMILCDLSHGPVTLSTAFDILVTRAPDQAVCRAC
jgi:hypothetical protein